MDVDVGSLRCTAPALGIPPDRHYDPTDTEDAALRMDWAKFLFRAGYRLRYPQETTATAILLFHRFLIKERVGKHWRSRDVILTTCLFLAGKVTEAPRRLRDVINVIHMLTSTGQEEPPLLDKAYWTMKERIVEFEQVLLRSINFQVDPPDPYRLLLNYARSLRLHRDVTRTAWCLVNDSLFCPRALATSQPAVACAAIRLAAKVHGCDRRLRWFSPPVKKCKRGTDNRGGGDGIDPGNRERKVETRDRAEGKGRDAFLAASDIGSSEALIVGPEAAGATLDGSTKRLLPSSVANLSTRQHGEAIGGEGSRVDVDEEEDLSTTPWWGVFDARDEEVELVSSELLALYRSHSDRDASGRVTVDNVAEKGVVIIGVRDKAVDATGLERSHKSLGVSSTLRDNH